MFGRYFFGSWRCRDAVSSGVEGFPIMVCIVQLCVSSVCIGRLHECVGGSFQLNSLATDFARPGTCLSGLLVRPDSGRPWLFGRQFALLLVTLAIVPGTQLDIGRAGGWLGMAQCAALFVDLCCMTKAFYIHSRIVSPGVSSGCSLYTVIPLLLGLKGGVGDGARPC